MKISRTAIIIVGTEVWLAFACIMCGGAPSLLVRAQNFTVLPSTGPVTYVLVKNGLATEYTGALRAQFPTGWKVSPAEHALALRPGETRKCAFTIERGIDRAANAYPVRLQVEGSGHSLVSTQQVVCASAPYYRPVIDGDLAEWKDSIPITFGTAGQKVIVRAYWSSKQFALAVEVEEKQLLGLKDAVSRGSLDALQFSLASAQSEARWEFLVAATDSTAATGPCYLLHQPGQAASFTSERRKLGELKLTEAKVAIKREGPITCYEVGLPIALMPELRPTAGREFCFSLLVHDPDDTGVRDLGEVMNLWPEHRQPGGWCLWEFVQWGDRIPYCSQIEFGFCSSIH